MRRLAGAAVAAALALASASVLAQQKPAFPRLGGIKIGSPQNYDDAAYRAQLAKLQLVLINVYPGWESSRGTTLQSVVSDIKLRNPQTKVFSYIANNEVDADPSSAWKEVSSKLTAEKWWLYGSGTSGSPVPSVYPGVTMTNYSLGLPANAAGERFNEWFARWAYRKLWASASALDGVYTDNFFWRPRVTGDWDRDGTTDGKRDADVLQMHRGGMRKHLDTLKSLMPGKYQIGNITDWWDPDASYPEYEQQLNGGIIEHIMGDSWSPEGRDWKGNVNTWGSWAEMMKRYRKIMRSVAEPKLVIFNQYGDPSDYQSFRYGFGSCLLDDGYYDFSTSLGGMFSKVVWFDEFNTRLGKAVSAPPTAAWKSGVWRRDFENGIVLVNPRGNGAQTVTLEADFKRIRGTQVPAVNSGQTTRTVTLKDRDGLVLLRLNAVAPPKAPGNLVVE